MDRSVLTAALAVAGASAGAGMGNNVNVLKAHEAAQAPILLPGYSKPGKGTELKPCPCCGGEARFGQVRRPGPQHGGHYIECKECHLGTSLVFPLKDDVTRELAERWNQRAPVSETGDTVPRSRYNACNADWLAERERADKLDAGLTRLMEAVQELRNIADAKRHDLKVFPNDTEFADWAQSRCRFILSRLSERGGEA